MIALMLFTARSDIMGEFRNRRLTNWVAWAGAAVVLTLNLFLILQTFGVPIPGLAGG
jgi:manganese transport protein